MQNIFKAKHANIYSITNVSSVPVDKQSCSISLSSFTVTILTSPSSEQADSLDNWSSLSYLQMQPELLLETFLMNKKFCFTVSSRVVLCAQQYKQQTKYIGCSTKNIQKSSILVKLAVHFALSYIISAPFFKYQLQSFKYYQKINLICPSCIRRV